MNEVLTENPALLMDVQLPSVGPTVSVPPTLLRLPDPSLCDFTRSQITLEWAAEAGYELDDWQQFVLWWMKARQVDNPNELAAKTVYEEVCRQNGKNIVLEVDQLSDLCLFGYTLLIHSAYRADTAHEHYLSLEDRIFGSDLLQQYLKPTGNRGFFSANGKEAIVLKGGQRLLFKTRSKTGGRGPRPQKLYFDEALILDYETVDSQVPAIVAQKGGQVVFSSSAPLKDSQVQHDLRVRAYSDEDPTDTRYFAVAWNNDPEIDDQDVSAQRRVNPSLGQGRMTLESLNENRRLMTLGGFVREHLGVPELPDDLGSRPIELEAWNNLGEKGSDAVTHRTVALAVSTDLQWATLAVAGRREDGKAHVEWKTRRPGTGWVVEECLNVQKAGFKVRIHQAGPEAAWIKRLEEKKVEVEVVDTTSLARACTALVLDIRNGGLRHLGQQTLAEQVERVAYRRTQEGLLMFSPKQSEGPVDALMAVLTAYEAISETDEDGDWFVY